MDQKILSSVLRVSRSLEKSVITFKCTYSNWQCPWRRGQRNSHQRLREGKKRGGEGRKGEEKGGKGKDGKRQQGYA